jgi:hypothetical protein
MSVADPGLGFWLRYTERGGALHEPGYDSTLVLLPTALQALFGIGEEVNVTSDPDVAREDGAMLIAPGHPVLDVATEAALAEGDVGRSALEWPARVPDDPALLEAAREQFPVDHGRISISEPAQRAYLPVLRLGTLVEYALSDGATFQERLESWVDATTAKGLAAGLRAGLDGHSPGPLEGYPVPRADLEAAVAAGHRMVDAQAAKRLSTLSIQAGTARDEEALRARAYYAEALAAIERRRAGAPADRQQVLDARAEATLAEQARRLEEIAEKHQVRHRITPYRLHLLLVPCLILPVDIMRGARRFPQTLTWIVPAATFRDLACPSCSRQAPLVAGKDRLGCEKCLSARTLTSVGPANHVKPTPSPAKPPTSAAVPRPKAEPAAPVTTKPAKPAARSTVSAPPLAVPKPLSPERLQRLGNDLSPAFWQAVVADDRSMRTMIAQHCPAATLFKFFGAGGLGVAAGLPPEARVGSLEHHYDPLRSGDLQLSSGRLHTRQRQYPFALLWRPVGRAAVVEEVLPYSGWRVGELAHESWLHTPGASLLQHPPLPAVALDPVSQQLWDVDLPIYRLPLVLRCLTAWLRIQAEVDSGAYPAPVFAAALLRLVSWRSGTRVSTADAAIHHGVDVGQTKLAEKILQKSLRLSGTQRW